MFFFSFASPKEKRTKKRKATVCTSGATPEVESEDGAELASLKQPPLSLRFQPPTLYAPTVRTEQKQQLKKEQTHWKQLI